MRSMLNGVEYSPLAHATNYYCAACKQDIGWNTLVEFHSEEAYVTQGLLLARKRHWNEHPECAVLMELQK